MAFLRFQFSDYGSLVLETVHFSHPLLAEPRQSVRGRIAGPRRKCSTFQWTAAVKALSILVLRTKAQAGLPPGDPLVDVAPLCGGSGSLAASLDYAINKQPRWIVDMFGVDGHKKNLVRRLVNRWNSERKDGGKVMLGTNPAQLPHTQIQCLLNGVEVRDPATLLSLAARVDTSEHAEDSVSPCSKYPGSALNSAPLPHLEKSEGLKGGRDAALARLTVEIVTIAAQRGRSSAGQAVPVSRERLSQAGKCEVEITGSLRIEAGEAQLQVSLRDSSNGSLLSSDSCAVLIEELALLCNK